MTAPGRSYEVSAEAEQCGFMCRSCVCAAESLQSCPILCNLMVCGPPGSFVHGILQARILEWVATSFSLSMYVDCNLQVIMQLSDLNLTAKG